MPGLRWLTVILATLGPRRSTWSANTMSWTRFVGRPTLGAGAGAANIGECVIGSLLSGWLRSSKIDDNEPTVGPPCWNGYRDAGLEEDGHRQPSREDWGWREGLVHQAVHRVRSGSRVIDTDVRVTLSFLGWSPLDPLQRARGPESLPSRPPHRGRESCSCDNQLDRVLRWLSFRFLLGRYADSGSPAGPPDWGTITLGYRRSHRNFSGSGIPGSESCTPVCFRQVGQGL